jgi:hypothetical protein
LDKPQGGGKAVHSKKEGNNDRRVHKNNLKWPRTEMGHRYLKFSWVKE